MADPCDASPHLYRQLLSSGNADGARPTLFLDRDGVINRPGRQGFVFDPGEFTLLDGVSQMIQRFNQMNWRVIVVTNQGGVAHGFYSEADVQAVHDHMLDQLSAVGASLDAIYQCPFDPTGSVRPYMKHSEWRKPRPGMLKQAMTDFAIDVGKSFLVGDKATDIRAAEATGVRGFLYRRGNLDTFAQSCLAAMAT